MRLGFSGEVAGFYKKYRRGYPPEVIDAVVSAFGLSTEDVVVDLGCGTGQLTLPLARRLRAAVGVDPEPDMLERAPTAGVDNITWVLGADTDLPALGRLFGPAALGAVTVGQALHWMDHDRLFRTAGPLLRDGGGVAVVTNGTPLWLQNTDWSRALRGVLEGWLGEPVTATCGTDEDSQQRYADSLRKAGFEVSRTTIAYAAEMDLDFVVGGVYSALSVDQLPPLDERPQFAERIRRALSPEERFTEDVRVEIIAGRKHR